MKKIGYVFCFLFAVLLTGCFVNSKPVFADVTAPTEISSVEQLQNIQENGNYILKNDIDFNGMSFDPITKFSGTLNGNGHTIKNVNLSEVDGDLAFFLETNGAKILNLQFDNISVTLNKTVDTYISKVAFLVANSQGTTIENCSITSTYLDENDKKVNSKIDINSQSSVITGAIVADAKGGTVLQNCYCTSDINVNGNSTNKNVYVGGVVGNFAFSQAYNVISEANISLSNVVSTSYVGGIAGYVLGDKSEIKNVVSKGELNSNNIDTNAIMIGSFVGSISCPTDTPNNLNLNYFYTSRTCDFVGNVDDLKFYYDNQIIKFNILDTTMQHVENESLYLKNFYTNTALFDLKKEWNFNSIWQISERIGLPFLQHFSTFRYTLSEDASFSSLTKPEQQTSIEFVSNATTFEYGGDVVVGGFVTPVANINKFYKIVGLRKDGETIFLNSKILDIVNNEQSVVNEVETNKKTYTLGSDVLTEEKTQINSNVGVLYKLNDDKIFWGTYTSSRGDDVNFYYIKDCNILNQGEYSFVLETIKYTINVSTENLLNGSVRRSTADSSVQNDIIKDEVFYGQTIGYVATPTSDFGFNGWKTSLDGEIIAGLSSRLIIKFNEKAFSEGGIFEGLTLGDDEINFVATFTKRVCNITIKFAVNNEIVDDILSKVYINDRELSAENNVISKKETMGSTCKIKVTLPTDYEFTNWFLSDGTSNLGVQSEELEFMLTIGEEEEIVLVANLYQEKDPINNMSYLWWIIGGSIAGIALIGLCVFLIVKKRKDNSYKNMYY